MRVKDSLQKMNVRPRKERGQNFLLDHGVLSTIVEFGTIAPGEDVVEIGPGLGALTELLVPLNLKAVVEIEPKFCTMLRERFPHVVVLQQDILTYTFDGYAAPVVVFGNIPYAISTQIVFHLIDYRARIHRAILLLQREFAERMAAEPGSKTYGVLSVNSQIFSEIDCGPLVPGTAFHPRANVDSRIIRMKFRSTPLVEEPLLPTFRRVVRGAFHQRRKKILNSLLSSGFATRAILEAALEESGISRDTRAEQVSIEAFLRLSRHVRDRTALMRD